MIQNQKEKQRNKYIFSISKLIEQKQKSKMLKKKFGLWT